MLDANNNSQTFQTLWEDPYTISKPFVYKIIGNFCNGARAISKVQASQPGAITSPHSLEVVFPIQRVAYYLQYLSVYTDVQTGGIETTAITATNNFGVMLYSRKELRTQGKFFWKSSNLSDQANMALLPFSKSQITSAMAQYSPCYKGAETVVPAAGGHFYTTTPILAPYFDKTYMYLDSILIYPMELAVIVETQQNLGLTAALTSITPICYQFFRTVDNEHYIATKKLNFTLGEPTTILASSTYDEPLVLAGASGQGPIMKCKNVIQSTSFFLVTTSGPGSWKSINPTTVGTKCIWSFDFIFAGQNVFTGIPTDMMCLDRGFRYDSANINCSNTGQMLGMFPLSGPHTIWFSEMADHTYNSFGLAMYNGAFPYYNFYFGTGVDTSYSVAITHNIWGFITIDGSSGTLEYSNPT
jgi:hypothetical protein